MSENYRNVAKQLNIRWRLWKYGITFLPRDPTGRVFRLFLITPLDGWIFEENQIVEAIANDPDWSISYDDQFSAPPSDDKKEGSHEN